MTKNNNAKIFSSVDIDYQIDDNYFKIIVDNLHHYFLIYPPQVWEDFPAKENLAENFIYARSAPLSAATDKKIIYHFPAPWSRKITDFGVLKDLPRISFVNKITVKDLLAKYQNRKFKFEKLIKGHYILPRRKTNSKKAVLALSFGKDSLLSYGLAKEIGLDLEIAYVNEMEKQYSAENEYKRKIIKKFCRDENVSIDFVEDNADEVFYNSDLDIKVKEFDNANGMLAFALEILPFAYYHQAKYLILGNEKNYDEFWLHQKTRAYPSFDQTSLYTAELNKFFKKITRDNFEVISLVEPLYNLAEVKILYHRYPKLLKYLMSCLVEENADDKWCYACPMCASIFLFSLAVGGDPQKIGFKKNLFQKKYKNLYPLFADKAKTAYEMPQVAKDEQLLSFLLVLKQGHKGELMELFKRNYLKEAQQREKELRKKFFQIYPSKNLSKNLSNKLNIIFKKELQKFI